MENYLEVAVKNIFYIIVDLAVCQFLMDKNFDYVLNSFCSSVKALSILIKSSYEIVDFVKHVINSAEHLDKICLFAIKNDDLDYFDEIMSFCSGVVKLYNTQKETNVKNESQVVFQNEEKSQFNLSDDSLQSNE